MTPFTRIGMAAITALLFLSNLSTQSIAAETFDVVSPDGAIQVTLTLDDGVPHYRVQRFGQNVITPSQLGVELKEGSSLAKNLAVVDTQRRSFDETWTQVWGEKK